jgi:tellurite resistance protein TehA-like permease
LALAGLKPSELTFLYPAMVMGTATLSSGAALLRMRVISVGLFAVGAFMFVLLCALACARVLHHAELVRTDLRSPRTAFAPYTFVIALCALGSRAALEGWVVVPTVALALALAGGVALGPLAVSMLRAHVRRPEAFAASWLLSSVALEALGLLAATVAPRLQSEGAAALAVALWVAGIPVYLAVIVLMVRRFRRFPVGAPGMRPGYWPLMALPTLIGLVAARLSAASAGLAAASSLRAAYEPAALAGLAISAAFLPAWIALQVGELMRDPSSRRYSPAWWGLVFPAAIMVVSTEVTGATFGVRWLHSAALAGFWCVLAVWGILVVGMVRDLFRRDVAAPLQRL